MQDGDFFNPQVWQNQQVPSLQGDTIEILHTITYNQALEFLSGSYLHVADCARLCGNQNITFRGNTQLIVHGELYAGEILLKGIGRNYGYIYASRLQVTTEPGTPTPSFAILCGYMLISANQYSCSRPFEGPPDTLFQYALANNTITLNRQPCKCEKEVTFADGSVITYSAGTASHTFAQAGDHIFTEVYRCPCDTFFVERRIRIDSVCTLPAAWEAFPNPTRGEITIQHSSCQNLPFNARVVNQLGQLLGYLSLNANAQTQVSLPDWSPGLYFIIPEQGTELKPLRVMVMH